MRNHSHWGEAGYQTLVGEIPVAFVYSYNDYNNTRRCSQIKEIEKHMGMLESKRKKLTEMLLDDTISKEAYDEKYDDSARKIEKAKKNREG